MTTATAPPPPATPPSFDIVSTYKALLAADPSLPMPIAAIESLVQALTSSRSTTISETLSLLQTCSNILRSEIPNPISLSAGTDLFQRYLITSLNRPESSDFPTLRNHILSNSRLFISRAKQAREKIASFGTDLIADGCTVMTYGGSRVVDAMLRRAADPRYDGSKHQHQHHQQCQRNHHTGIRFRVMYILPSPDTTAATNTSSALAPPEGHSTVDALRALGVPVATVPVSAVAYVLGKVDMLMVGAEGVVENGGIISRMGTYQLGLLAHAMKKPFYVVAESYKFVRLYPLGQYDLPVEQRGVVEFLTAEDERRRGEGGGAERVKNGQKTSGRHDGDFDDSSILKEKMGGYFDQKPVTPGTDAAAVTMTDAVDFTPPRLISALITENGVLTPSAVSEELIKLWF